MIIPVCKHVELILISSILNFKITILVLKTRTAQVSILIKRLWPKGLLTGFMFSKFLSISFSILELKDQQFSQLSQILPCLQAVRDHLSQINENEKTNLFLNN